MGFIGTILVVIGAIIALIFGIILLIKAFKTSIWWGLGYLFVPFVSLVFVFMHWEQCKKPFLYVVAGIVLAIAGSFLGGPDIAEVPVAP